MVLYRKANRLAALICGLVIFGTNPVWGEGEFLSSLEKDVTNLVEMVKPCLVTINTRYVIKTKSLSPSDKKIKTSQTHPREKIYRIGSGVIFDKAGHIITSASVVTGGNEFEVVLADARKLKAELVGLDAERNLAVLKVSAPNLVPARLGNSDQLKAGSWVTILGNSYGLPSAVAVGLFNGLRPDGFIQMSASVAPGNSGGPVLNSKGEVVGLVSAKVSEASSFSIVSDENGQKVKIIGSQGRIDLPSSSISLAIPINQVKLAAQQIIEHGSIQKGFLGVYLEDEVSREGIYISEIVEESPAHKAGIKPGDRLVYFDGKKVQNSAEFRKLVEETPPNQSVVIKVLRQDRPVSLTAQIGSAQPPFASGFEAEWDFDFLKNLSSLKEWEVTSPGYEPPEAPSQKQAQELKEYLLQARQQLNETQKAYSAYTSGRMEKRISELEQRLEDYRKDLDSLRLELQKMKVNPERP